MNCSSPEYQRKRHIHQMVSQVAHLKETKRCARCALYASQGRPEDGDPGRRMRLPGPLLARWVGEATGREHRTPYPRVGCARRQDADKQRPSYGRGLVLFARTLRKTDAASLGGRDQGASAPRPVQQPAKQAERTWLLQEK